MPAKELIDLLDAAQLDPHVYSGRGMYGKTCPAFQVDADSINLLLAFAQIDSMGKGWIVYFPRYIFEAKSRTTG